MESNLPLRDIHLPDPIGWWPLAPGWWLLMFGVPVVLILSVWLWRFLRRKTIKKMALRELEEIAGSKAKPVEKVQKLNILLRRISLSLYPREEVAGLVGVEWLAFLDRQLQKASKATQKLKPSPTRGGRGEVDQSMDFLRNRPGIGNSFSEGAGRILIDAPYRNEVQEDLEALFVLCREWINHLPKPVRLTTSRQSAQKGVLQSSRKS